jgi:hypothetical protein
MQHSMNVFSIKNQDFNKNKIWLLFRKRKKKELKNKIIFKKIIKYPIAFIILLENNLLI